MRVERLFLSPDFAAKLDANGLELDELVIGADGTGAIIVRPAEPSCVCPEPWQGEGECPCCCPDEDEIVTAWASS